MRSSGSNVYHHFIGFAVGLCLLLASFVGISGQVFAEGVAASDITVVSAKLDSDSTVTVGDRLIYRAEFEHPLHTSVEIDRPQQGSRWAELNRRITTDEHDETSVTQATIEYAIYRPGPTSGPPVNLRIVDADTPEHISLAEHELHVEAVSEEGESLGDPRSPWPLWTTTTAHLWVLAGTAGFGFLALLGFVVMRRRRIDDLLEPVPSAEERALESLRRLRDANLIAEEEWEPFYVRLSTTIRRYLGRRFDFPGTELTTTEIIDKIGALDDPDFQIDTEVVARWLRACDRVKFAGHIPAEQSARDHLDEAFHIVEKTKKRPPPDPSESESGVADGDGESEESPPKTSEHGDSSKNQADPGDPIDQADQPRTDDEDEP